MIDFIDPVAWPAFNVADSCIVWGVPAAVGGGGDATSADDLIASGEDAGLRLDAFLAARGAAASRSAAQRLIEAGRRDRRRAQARPKNHRVAGGRARRAGGPAAEATGDGRRPAIEIVYEDAYLLVVDKPAGLVTHPAPGHSGTTLAEALAGHAAGGSHPRACRHRAPARPGHLGSARRGPLGRCARPAPADDAPREITREYLALVSGHPDAESGTIDAPIGRDRGRRTVMSTRTDRARGAVTHFEVLERLPRTALLSVRLETGRTHQIRAHLAAIGHPVCGDRGLRRRRMRAPAGVGAPISPRPKTHV